MTGAGVFAQCNGDCTTDCGHCKGQPLTYKVSDCGGSEGVWVFRGQGKRMVPFRTFDTDAEAQSFVDQMNGKVVTK